MSAGFSAVGTLFLAEMGNIFGGDNLRLGLFLLKLLPVNLASSSGLVRNICYYGVCLMWFSISHFSFKLISWNSTVRKNCFFSLIDWWLIDCSIDWFNSLFISRITFAVFCLLEVSYQNQPSKGEITQWHKYQEVRSAEPS